MEPAFAKLTSTMAPYANGKSFANFTERPVGAERPYPLASWQRLRNLRASVDPHDTMLAVRPISPATRPRMTP